MTTSSTNANGVSVTYTYDSLNKLATVRDNANGARPGTGTTTYSYDPVGNLASYLYPNGVQTTNAYNSLNRLTNMSVIGSQNTTLASYAYTLGATGNRLSVTENSGRTVSYSYDDLYRLTNETINNDPNTSNNGSIGYLYDSVGNRLSRTSTLAAVPNQAAIYNANDRVSSNSYDNNGNTISTNVNSYDYDFANLLTSLNNGAVSYIYDGDGNRVAKTVNGVTTKYLIDTHSLTRYAQVVEEIVNGSVQCVYTYGDSRISLAQLTTGNWTTRFYGYDGHGNVRFLTDGSETLTEAYDYDAFGNPIRQTGTTQDYLYSGERFDRNLGFYYSRARYLDPSSGRFWTRDTVEGRTYDPQSLHKYLYANANPINLIGPSGHDSVAENLTVAFGLAALATLIILTAAKIHLFQGPLPDLLPKTQQEEEPETKPDPEPHPEPEGETDPPIDIPVGPKTDKKDDDEPYEDFYRAMGAVEYAKVVLSGGSLTLKAKATELFVSRSYNYALRTTTFGETKTTQS